MRTYLCMDIYSYILELLMIYMSLLVNCILKQQKVFEIVDTSPYWYSVFGILSIPVLSIQLMTWMSVVCLRLPVGAPDRYLYFVYECTDSAYLVFTLYMYNLPSCTHKVPTEMWESNIHTLKDSWCAKGSQTNWSSRWVINKLELCQMFCVPVMSILLLYW